MKRHLLRGVTASLVAVVVSLPVGARPAAAAEDSILDYVKTGIEIVKLLFGGGMSVEEAVQRIEARITAAETAIIANNQRLAAAEARACATGAVANFVNFPSYNPDNKQAFAIATNNCVALIESLRGVTTDKAALDTLGFASQVITPIALTVNRAVGFQTGPLVALLRAFNERLIIDLAPVCDSWVDTGGTYPIVVQIHYYKCVAHNGDWDQASRRRVGSNWVDPPIDQARVQANATARTSRAVAVAILPQLVF